MAQWQGIHLPMQQMQETWVRSLGGKDSPGEGNGNSLWCSSLRNPTDRGAWWAQSMGSRRVGHDRAQHVAHPKGTYRGAEQTTGKDPPQQGRHRNMRTEGSSKKKEALTPERSLVSPTAPGTCGQLREQQRSRACALLN